jgi:hypothetical protein
MKFHVMRETPDNSGTYADVGSEHDTADAAVAHVMQHLAHLGGRYALRLYEPVRTDAQHAADLAAAQEAGPQPGAAEPQPAPEA